MRLRLSPLLALLLILAASPLAAQTRPIALTGTLVMPEEVIPGGTVLLQNGRIVASGVDVKLPAGTQVIPTGGVIAPGLVDLHNHLTWNVFPRWHPIEAFGNRYDWQQKPVYNILLTVPHAQLVQAGLECEMERYAEVKALTQGETSLTGGMLQPCANGLARNLDYNPELPGGPYGTVIYNVFPLQMDADAFARGKAALAATPRGSLLIHLGEGSPSDAAAAREFAQLKGSGLLLPGVSLIHAGGVTAAGFKEMHDHGVGFIWSPRSNIELYGDTARVAAASDANVTIALAPDWSPTGSDGLLGELNYASVWNQTQTPQPFHERDLVLMATANAARLVNLSAEIGSLAPGHVADLIVLTKTGEDAYATLTHSGPQDLQLVVVGGVAMYGDPALLQQFSGKAGEPLTVCGTSKSLALGSKPYADTAHTLDLALQRYGRELAPLAECGQ